MHNLRTIHRVLEDGSTFGILDSTMCLLFLILIEKLVLNSGSSQQGKAILECVVSKSVTAIILWKHTISVRIKLKPVNELIASTSISSLEIVYLSSYNFSQFRPRFWKEMKLKLTQRYWSTVMYHTGQTLYTVSFMFMLL